MPLTYLYPKSVAERPDFETMRENQTYGVCMSLMGLAIDITKTTEDGQPDPIVWSEFKRRVLIFEALNSPLFSKEGVSMTLEVFKNHWGISTNVSTQTPMQWDKKVREAYNREENYARKA